MSKSLRSRQAVEMLSILGIAAIFLYAELSFSFFSTTIADYVNNNTTLKLYSYSVFGAIFIGLAVYSLSLRTKLKFETKARLTIEEDLKQYKVADPITGLPNRLGFELVSNDRIECVSDGSLALLAIGFSNLETIRGVHGSKISERVELGIADYLVSLAEKGDFIANGERSTFYMMIEGSDMDFNRFRVDQIVESIIALARKGVSAGHANLQLHVNFGVVCIDDLEEINRNAEAAIQRVDFAMGKARSKAREECVCFDISMETEISHQALVEVEIIPALALGQIVPYFQPLIDLKSNSIVGFEILARWQHPEQGIIMPDIFIPVAEESGALRALTLHMLKQACQTARDWPKHMSIAINVSPTDLRNDSMIEEFLQILEETGIEKQRIEIEITENAFIEESGDIADTISKFKQEGMTISIDDFGTGYSSLHHLRVLSFDKIKIDRSFINNMHTDPESHEIVKTIVALGKSLGLPTTAEGIEIDDNRDLLNEMGCAIGQGYLYARPLPASDVSEFINSFDNSIEADNQVA